MILSIILSVVILILGYFLFHAIKIIKVLNEMIIKFAELSQNIYKVSVDSIKKIDDLMKEMDLMKKNMAASIKHMELSLENNKKKFDAPVKDIKDIAGQLVKASQNFVILDKLIKK